ncbi:MAG: SusC/RagA family TonB-linked outer membrane protein [Bacteroidales bacterium]|nr:SusC/RagA family TonB-linked outer membrane protein [Bacteroidales bacterium]
MTKQLFAKAATIIMILAASLLGTGSALAQNPAIRGKVVDASNAGVVGAYVVVPGTTNGVSTDIDGNFEIRVAPGTTLEVSCIGYVTKRAAAAANMIVTLEDDAEMLEETVVIGYGVVKKSDLSGSVASVSGDELRNRATSDAATALQGKAAGVQVINASGAPGKGAEIRVRGYSTNDVGSGSLGPLLIVDGMKVDNIQYLDPEMIESMEILKDAASAAVYGVRAGNGVVLITTKSGKKGEGKIFYNGQFQLSSISRKLDIMNAAQYIELGRANGYLTESDLSTKYDGVTDVNWGKDLFVPTWSNRHTVGFSGGNDRGHLFASINNVHNNGIFRGDKDVYDRLTFQVNADYKIKDWLTVTINNSIEKWGTKSVSEANDNGSALLSAITSSPLFPIRGDESKLSPDMIRMRDAGVKLLKDPETGLYWTVPLIGETQSGHPYVQRDATDTQNGGFTIRGVASLDFNPFKGFVFTSRLGYRISQNTSHSYTEPYFSTATIKADNYTLNASANTSYSYQWENFVNYNRTFGKLELAAMAGMSFEQEFSDGIFVQGVGPDILKGYEPNFRYLSYMKFDNNTLTITNAPGYNASMSYFGRLSFIYDNRYSITGIFRADAFDTSYMPADSRWGYFPSVSGYWNISNEPFFKDNVNRDVISLLKLRASYGINGNINVLKNRWAYDTTILLNRVWYQYDVNDPAMVYGSLPSGLSNRNLKWETSRQLDLGLDARMFNNRLTIGLVYFNKITSDQLVPVPAPMEVGTPSYYEGGPAASTIVNAGRVLNRGFEVELSWRDQIGDFSYGISANAGWLKNKVTYLDPLAGRLQGRKPQGTDVYTAFEEGYPVWYLRGFQAEGINADGQVVYTQFDADGNKKGTTVSPDPSTDLTYIGKAIPDLTYGLTINLAWKNFDLTIFGNGVAGNNLLPTAFRVDRPSCNTYAYYWKNSWKKAGDEATAKFPGAKNWTQQAFSSSLTVFKGDYFKIKTIQLGYTLPKNVTKAINVSSLRIYAMLDNFFTFSNYIGLDPETAIGTGNALGLDMGNYPTAKSVIFGLNLEF